MSVTSLKMFAGGFAMLTGGILVFEQMKPSFFSRTPAKKKPSEEIQLETLGNRPILKHGLPGSENVRSMSEILCSINYERRIPNWVLEYFDNTGGHLKEKSDRKDSKFYSDSNVPEVFRAKDSDYQNSTNLSRGHLAPAQFHKGSQDALNETFNLSANIVPQDMSMNACDWLRLEDMVKRMQKTYAGHEMWVITGPAFVPTTFLSSEGISHQEVRYRVIGKHNVAVPSHMFKVLGVERGDKLLAAAFLMPNGPIPEERPLTAYQLPLSELESVSGLQFFPKAIHREKPMKVLDLCRETKGGCSGSFGSFSTHYRLQAKLAVADKQSQCRNIMALPEAIKDQKALKRDFDKCLERNK